jgi:organic radical activating enzyme
MFGTNPLRKQELDPTGTLWVQEIFPTIQGEGPNAGCSALFLRLGGCNLRCWFCDTDFESSTLRLSASALAERIVREIKTDRFQGDLIVVTGGEPLRQNLVPLFRLLELEDFRIQIETAGTIWVPGLEEFGRDFVELVCSPKTGKLHEMIERYCWDYKYIVRVSEPTDHEDGLPLCFTQAKWHPAGVGTSQLMRPRLARPSNPAATIWVQPCDEGDEALNNANRDYCAALTMKYGYRLSLQQHKILNLP